MYLCMYLCSHIMQLEGVSDALTFVYTIWEEKREQVKADQT